MLYHGKGSRKRGTATTCTRPVGIGFSGKMLDFDRKSGK